MHDLLIGAARAAIRRIVIDSAPSMACGPLRSMVVGLMGCLAVLAPAAEAQQPAAVEYAFPTQLARGQATVVHLAIPGRLVFQSAEVSPSAGVTVAGVMNRKPPELSQNVGWWDVTLDIARDAMPGPRSLVLLTAAGRTVPVTVVIPTHVPVISGLRAVPATSTPPAIDVQFAMADESADVGNQPYVWFSIRCGGEPTVGVVRGMVNGGMVRASIPRPAPAACDLEVRASDAQKNDSNSLTTRVQ